MFRRILIPIDTAEPAIAEPAVYFGAQLAALTDAAVRIIHVLPNIPLNLGRFLPAHVNADREHAARSILLEMAKNAKVPTGCFSVTVRTGEVADEVLAEAESWLAHLIIVGSHKPSLRSKILGSNAEKILHHANCSVMVVRPYRHQDGTYWLVPPIGS